MPNPLFAGTADHETTRVPGAGVPKAVLNPAIRRRHVSVGEALGGRSLKGHDIKVTKPNQGLGRERETVPNQEIDPAVPDRDRSTELLSFTGPKNVEVNQ